MGLPVKMKGGGGPGRQLLGVKLVQEVQGHEVGAWLGGRSWGRVGGGLGGAGMQGVRGQVQNKGGG